MASRVLGGCWQALRFSGRFFSTSDNSVNMSASSRVWLDYVSAAPVDPRVLEAMDQYNRVSIGNPSSAHSSGQEAREAVEAARSGLARVIGADGEGKIVFLSGATEANNLALKGVARRKGKGKILVSSIEHLSILNVAKELEREGFVVEKIPVDSYGLVDPSKIDEMVGDETILVSVMYANGEIGTVEPIREIGEILQQREVVFHVDAVHAAGKIPVDVKRDHIDLLTLSSNEIYGPKGVGALFISSDVKLRPLLQGGGQEFGIRSGSENVPGIVGFGKAAQIAASEMEKEAERTRMLRDMLVEGVVGSIPNSHLTGHRSLRLPNHASFYFPYIEGESIILGLDFKGIAASTGSACTSKTLQPSHVLLAIGLKPEDAHGSLVLTTGRWSEKQDVERLLEALPGVVSRLREMSPLTC